jgi:hypothetical protein
MFYFIFVFSSFRLGRSDLGFYTNYWFCSNILEEHIGIIWSH